jgi:hypothetical protein
MKSDAAAFGFPTDSTEDIRGRHWPLLGKNATQTVILNASKGSTLTPVSPRVIGSRPVSRWFNWLIRTYNEQIVARCATSAIILSMTDRRAGSEGAKVRSGRRISLYDYKSYVEIADTISIAGRRL